MFTAHYSIVHCSISNVQILKPKTHANKHATKNYMSSTNNMHNQIRWMIGYIILIPANQFVPKYCKSSLFQGWTMFQKKPPLSLTCFLLSPPSSGQLLYFSSEIETTIDQTSPQRTRMSPIGGKTNRNILTLGKLYLHNFEKFQCTFSNESDLPKAGILGTLDTEEHFPKPSRLRNILNI